MCTDKEDVDEVPKPCVNIHITDVDGISEYSSIVPNKPCVENHNRAVDISPNRTSPVIKYKKPKRPCYICGQFQAKLTRHIMLKHKSVEKVASAMKLSKEERDLAFQDFRKIGILEENKKIMMNLEIAENSERILREHRGKSNNLIICGYCNGFYSRRYISKHKQICKNTETNVLC